MQLAFAACAQGCTVYDSSCCDKHNRPCCDLILWSYIPWSISHACYHQTTATCKARYVSLVKYTNRSHKSQLS